jgi:hypothetical protein
LKSAGGVAGSEMARMDIVVVCMAEYESGAIFAYNSSFSRIPAA